MALHISFSTCDITQKAAGCRGNPTLIATRLLLRIASRSDRLKKNILLKARVTSSTRDAFY
jgi:hypothetical protein